MAFNIMDMVTDQITPDNIAIVTKFLGIDAPLVTRGISAPAEHAERSIKQYYQCIDTRNEPVLQWPGTARWLCGSSNAHILLRTSI